MELSKQEIEISSLKEIIDKVPIDCIDSFLVDLKSRIEITHKANELMKVLPAWSLVHDDTTIQRVNDWENYADIKIDLLSKDLP